MTQRLSWQITVAAAGSAVQGMSTPPGFYAIKANPTNTGVMYIGNDASGTVAGSAGTATGYPLEAGQQIMMLLENLNKIFVDATVNGERVSVLLMETPRDADRLNL